MEKVMKPCPLIGLKPCPGIEEGCVAFVRAKCTVFDRHVRDLVLLEQPKKKPVGRPKKK